MERCQCGISTLLKWRTSFSQTSLCPSRSFNLISTLLKWRSSFPHSPCCLYFLFCLQCPHLCSLDLKSTLSMLPSFIYIQVANLIVKIITHSYPQGPLLSGEQTAVWDCDWGEVSGTRASHCDNPCRWYHQSWRALNFLSPKVVNIRFEISIWYHQSWRAPKLHQ